MLLELKPGEVKVKQIWLNFRWQFNEGTSDRMSNFSTVGKNFKKIRNKMERRRKSTKTTIKHTSELWSKIFEGSLNLSVGNSFSSEGSVITYWCYWRWLLCTWCWPFQEWVCGGAVVEWSKALLKREKINEKPKKSQVRPQPGQNF